jgi:hypothetical protein
VIAVSAATASAQETQFTIDEGRINLGEQKGLALIDPAVPDPPATLTGTVTGTSFAAPASGFAFPNKTLQDIEASGLTVDALVEFTALAPISGTFDSATGALDIDVLNVMARLTVYQDGTTPEQALGICTVSPIPLPLGTTGEIVDDVTDPDNPVTYAASPFDPEGAAVATWASLPASVQAGGTLPALVCPAIDDLLGGPGGIWLDGAVGDADPPDTCATNPALCPQPGPIATCANTPSLCPKAPAKKCKKGFKKKKIKGKIKCVKSKKGKKK